MARAESRSDQPAAAVRRMAAVNCERCNFGAPTSRRPLLFVQSMKPARRDDPPSAKNADSPPFWVCSDCHAPKEKILRLVDGG
jgi:hypothetical protein